MERTGYGVRERIGALAERHQLAPLTVDRLDRYVRLLDCDTANFVPATAPELPEPATVTESQLQRALRVFAECLSVLDVESVRAAGRLADIGSGAGLPGVVLAVALPDTRVSLIESNTARAGLLGRITEVLELGNAEVVAGPVQAWSAGVDACDVVTLRRVGRPESIMEPAARLLTGGGVAVLFVRQDEDKQRATIAAAEAKGMTFESVVPVTAGAKTRTERPGKRVLHVYRKHAPSSGT